MGANPPSPGGGATPSTGRFALDPLNPRRAPRRGTIAFASRRYADAITQGQRALDLNPKISNAYASSGTAS